MSTRGVGVVGGTFDPVHNGHLAMAEHVLRQLGLTEVLFIPAPRPWMKEGCVWAGAEERLAMIELVISGQLGLRASRVDVDRPGPTYSIDTVRDVARQLGPGVGLYFIVGADTLVEMAEWRQPERIFQECTVVALARRGHPGPEQLPTGHPGRDAMFLEWPGVDVSASEIRRRVAHGESIDDMVPPEVERFIRERGLYRVAGH